MKDTDVLEYFEVHKINDVDKSERAVHWCSEDPIPAGTITPTIYTLVQVKRRESASRVSDM